MLKLKPQHFGHLMQRADSLEKTLMLGKIEGMKRRGQQRIRQLDGITDSMSMNLGEFQEIVRDQRLGVLQSMGSQILGHVPGGSEVKVSACNAGDLGLILGSGRSPREGNGNPLQYSCLENPMD